MFGDKNHFKISSISAIILLILGFGGLIDSFLELNSGIGWSGWLFWAFILYFIVKLKHPPVADVLPLDKKRMYLGYLAYFILILSFSPAPIMLNMAG
jgi:hypothetical protein